MRLFAVLLLVLATSARGEVAPVSGYEYLTPETRALQDDDFANPGMLWVDLGARLWAESPGSRQSCAGCHGPPETLRGVGASYPKWSEAEGRVISLEQRVNLCRTTHQAVGPLAYGSDALIGISALIQHQSRGLPVSVAIDGPAAAAYRRGRAYYETRRGQLNLSCANCHVQHVGERLRGEVISQGQVNGFPIYRQLWQSMGSVGRMIAWCNDAVRATPLTEGSAAAVELELYLRARGNGLRVEAPAVRR